MFSEELKLEGYVCPVKMHYLKFYSSLNQRRITMSDLSIAGDYLYQCEVRQSTRCDSSSICSTDECHCTNKGTIMTRSCSVREEMEEKLALPLTMFVMVKLTVLTIVTSVYARILMSRFVTRYHK